MGHKISCPCMRFLREITCKYFRYRDTWEGKNKKEKKGMCTRMHPHAAWGCLKIVTALVSSESGPSGCFFFIIFFSGSSSYRQSVHLCPSIYVDQPHPQDGDTAWRTLDNRIVFWCLFVALEWGATIHIACDNLKIFDCFIVVDLPSNYTSH